MSVGYDLRLLNLADVDQAANLSAGVGWNQDANDWRRLISLYPDGCVGAFSQGELVGSATLVTYGPNAGWLGMVIVAEQLRGHGLGSRLVEAALATAPSGDEVVLGLDATGFGAGLYRRYGFNEVADIDRWQGVLRGTGDVAATGTPVTGDLEIRAATAMDLPELIGYDARYTGVDRSQLLRYLIDEVGVTVVVARQKEQLVGYAVLRAGRINKHVGPVVAEDPAVAEQLIAWLAPVADGTPVFLDAVRAPERTELLSRLGLTAVRSLLRMTKPAQPLMVGPAAVAATAFEWG